MWTKDNIPDQSGKMIIVTGANAGIGFETALALYEAGAHVVLACRNLGKANEAIVRIKQSSGAGVLEAAQLDLGDLNSVRQFAETFIKQHLKLDVLINNAGIMIPPATKTVQGFESQFGVNFIGHFALTGYLYPILNSTPGSRIITLSSMAYLYGKIDFDNLKSEKDYEPMREYQQSKLADLILSVELQRRITAKGDGVLSIAAQPGANKTELSRHMSVHAYKEAVERVGELMEPWQGALPSLYAAVSNEVTGGALYGPDEDGGYRGYPAEATITANALDEDVAKKLWKLAEEVTGLIYPAV
ncbi:oxidoreductase [Pedobacter antarcticus]|uniref:oxidoreductase n=1 Tax=Pedobacter antarcticus TaxID=34086 RepID=UPI00292F2B88|nr:oxidoreductase [Pedobacter antarcticus]